MTRYIFNHQNNDGGWGLYVNLNMIGKLSLNIDILNLTALCLAQLLTMWL